LTAHLIAPVVTVTSVNLSSNKIHNEDILVLANPGLPVDQQNRALLVDAVNSEDLLTN